MATDKEKAEAAVSIVLAIRDTIKELKCVPSGHLYVRLMEHMSLETFQKILHTMEEAGVITVKHHVIKWVGPK